MSLLLLSLRFLLPGNLLLTGYLLLPRYFLLTLLLRFLLLALLAQSCLSLLLLSGSRFTRNLLLSGLLLASLLSVRKVLVVDPAIVFRGG